MMTIRSFICKLEIAEVKIRSHMGAAIKFDSCPHIIADT
jgi:hypothetical protein